MNFTSNTSIGPTPTKGVYPSPEAILNYLQELGGLQGYVAKKADQYPNPARSVETGKIYLNYFVCTCKKARNVDDWQYKSHTHDFKRRKKIGSKTMQCPFRIKDHRLDVEGTMLRLEVLNGEHNHEHCMARSADPVNRFATII